MKENASTLETFLLEIARAFTNLSEIFSDLDTIELLMEELGWDIEGILDGLENEFRSKFQVLDTLPELEGRIEALVNASTEEGKVEALIYLGETIAQIADELQELEEEDWSDSIWPAPFNTTEFQDDLEFLPRRLLDYLITSHVSGMSFRLYASLRLFGVFREERFIPEPNASSFRIEHDYVGIDWSLFSTLVNNPKNLAEQMYGWNTQAGDTAFPLDATSLIVNLANFFNAYGLSTDVVDIYTDLASVFYEEESNENIHPPLLNLPLFQGLNPITQSGYMEAGFNICPVPRETLLNSGTGIADGLLIYPYASHETDTVIQLSQHAQLTIETEADTSATIGLELLPSGVKLVLPGEVATPSGSVNIAIANTPETPLTMFTTPSGSGILIGSVGAGIQGKVIDESFEVVLKTWIEQGIINIQGGEGDGFLKKILPDDGIEANFDVSALWSSQTGFHLEGSGALEVTLPIHTRLLDAINIDSIYLFVGAGSDGVSVKVGITGDVELGPVLATIKQIGVRGDLSFPQSGGNLGGSANIDFGFLPPTGAGLALNSSGISGGGFLEFDDLNKRYAGILALKFDDIALTAIGLITTRLPDGSDGFSLLVNIGVRFSPPIQLSFGFTLSGVGGLIGVNRTMRIEPLRTGLKNHTLDSILFPDPSTVIVNANRIISDLRAVFPPEEGHYIIAPMVVIGWGSPNIITAELGVFLELPGLNQIVVLGQIGATFPNEDNVVVELHLDVLGVLDAQRKKFFINASLYDSSILSFQLRGDAGLLWSWGDRPNFALTLGGFHPDFKQVPQELTTIQERLSLIIRDTKNLKIKGEVYKALTSNTLQFGARIDLYAKKGRGSIDGYLGFDGLIIFSPFGFIVTIEGGVSARAYGRKLASVKLRLELQGPTPWVADGYASFKVCWKSIKVGFHKTWGQDSTPSIPAVDPLVPLLAALSKPSSWGAVLPDGMFLAESLRTLDEDTTGTDSEQQDIVIVHPAGAIEIRPNVLPFNIELQRFGNAPVKNHNRFAIKVSDLLNSDYGLDYFARNQFESLNEDEKLSKPSFEALDGVVTIRSNNIEYGSTVKSCPLYYETILIDDNNISTRPENNGKYFGVDWLFATRLLAGNAANVGSWRMSGKYRYQITNPTSKVAISEESFHVVSMSDQNITQLGNSLANNDGTLAYWAAEQALSAYTTQNLQQQGQLQLVAQYELAANQKLAPVAPLPVADIPEEIDQGTPIAYYHFLPWLRVGLSTLIKQQTTGIRAKFNIEAEIVADQLGSNSQEIESIPVQTIHLYGPGDIQAIDERMIVRTDPKPYTSDAEPNYFPMIEFADPDFAWRIPSNKIDSDLPWLTLIVLNEEEFTAFQAGEDKTNCITVNTSSLPNLNWARRWAHVQVTSAGDEQDPEDLMQEELKDYLKNKPQQVISRLLCARRLNPSTKYHAFVVPTFKLAHVPHIGLPNENDNAATPAWDSVQSSETNLVYYYRWEFMTGLRGDFEHLVRLLEKRKLSNLGITTIDCSSSGYGLNFNEGREADLPQTLGMEGALMSLDTEFSNWGNDKKDEDNQPTPEITTFQRSLADKVLNIPAENLLFSDSDPIIAPPIYGQWQAQRNRVDPDSNNWLDHLNLDPRHRAVSGLGTKVIRKQQESLMASAWKQVGDIDEANERLRRAQLGRAASISLFERMQAQATGDFLRLTASMFAKVKPVSANSEKSTTIYSKFVNSRIPMATIEPAFQRIQRTYQKRRVIENSSSGDILERLNTGEIAAAGSLPSMGGMPSICDISVEMLKQAGVTKLIENACQKDEGVDNDDDWKKRLDLFCYENLSCEKLTQEVAKITEDYGEKLDTRAREALNLLLEFICEDINEYLGDDEETPAPIDLEEVKGSLIIALNPSKTIPERTLANVDFGVLPVPDDPCAERQVIVRFPQPMYEALRDISKDYILPGIENIPKNTVGLLKTNRRFIESYLLGCNHELSSEALWRELPVPLGDSFFRQFWDVKDYMPTESDIGEVGLDINHPDFSEKMDKFLERKLKDISHIVDWGDSRLGENNNPFYQANNSDQQERTILIIRGDLLKKYPNPVIYAVPAFSITNDEDSTVPALPEFKYRVSELQGDEFDSEIERRKDPVISGFLPADIKFFGFEIDPEDSRYWYIVIEERVSEARFGLDTFEQGSIPPLNSRNDLSWGHIPLASEEYYINGEEPKDLDDNSLPEWGKNSSIIACDTLQKPARVVIKAETMIPG